MYTVKFYTGDYYNRQQRANQDKAIAYVEHHFNSASTPLAEYAVTVVGSNASQTSMNWGRWYAKAICDQFQTSISGNDGILVGGWNGRGDANLRHTKMPAILLEPLFASNPAQAEIIRSESGQTLLAQVLAESIYRFFPEGGLIAFSVGHKYKERNPDDRGASLAGGGMEADYAEKVLEKTKIILEGSSSSIPSERIIRVIKNNEVIFETTIDEDVDITWSSSRDLLMIKDSL